MAETHGQARSLVCVFVCSVAASSVFVCAKPVNAVLENNTIDHIMSNDKVVFVDAKQEQLKCMSHG